jgi:hypothetical protein
MITLPIPRLVENSIDDVDARALIDWIRWWRPLRVVRRRGPGFRHPWDIAARWNAEAKSWEIQIEPGYVNAAEVRAPRIDGDTLTDRPWIPVPANRLRSVDGAGDGSEAIPPFFARLGVRSPDVTTSDAFGLSTNLAGTLEDRAQDRRLRAVDILIQQPRPRVESVIERGPGGVAQLVASLATPSGADAVPRIGLRRDAFDPAPLPATIQGLLATGAVDDGFDRLRLGTLYLLSPPGATETAEPDGAWQAYPVSRVFWNLNHAITKEVAAVPPQRFSLNVPLAGGVAQGIIDAQINAQAAADAAAAAFVSRARIEGRFWTV